MNEEILHSPDSSSFLTLVVANFSLTPRAMTRHNMTDAQTFVQECVQKPCMNLVINPEHNIPLLQVQ